MATPTTTIDALPSLDFAADGQHLIVQDAGVTKRMPVGGLTGYITGELEAEVNGLNTRCDGLETANAAQDGEITAISDQSNANNLAIGVVEDRCTALEADVTALEAEVAGLPDPLTQAEGDARYLQLTGGAVSGLLTGVDINATGTVAALTLLAAAQVIINGAAPTMASHAARKDYVDNAVATRAPLRQTVATFGATALSLGATDENKLLCFTAATPVTVTIPTWATTLPVDAGWRVDIAQLGDGKVSVVGAGGVTITATPSAGARAKGSVMSLIKVAMPDTWLLTGDLA